MAKVTRLYDGLSNVLANLGTRRDKAALSHYEAQSLTTQELLNAYRHAWLPRKLVDLPAGDATRSWREWDDEAVAELEHKLQVKQAVKHALIDARLYGDSAIWIETDRETLTAPLQPDEQIKSLHVVQYNNPVRNLFSWAQRQSDTMQVQGRAIHRTRLCLFRGAYVPGQSQGDSVLNAAYETIRNADSIAANVASLVFEAKVDVIKVPDLSEQLMTASGEDALMSRLQTLQAGKSITNAALLDASEEWDQKQVSLAGLYQTVMTAYQLASGACNIPATRLLGQAVSGLTSTGESELREYYDTISDVQASKIEPAIARLDNLLRQNAGADDAAYQWRSLWQESASQRADNVGKLAAALGSLATTELYSDDQLMAAGGELLGDYTSALRDPEE